MKKQYSGGAVDGTISDKARQLICSISDDPNLIKKIATLVGRYRGEAQRRDTEPAKYQFIDELERVVKSSEELSTSLDLLPDSINVMFAKKCQRAGYDIIEAHSYLGILENQLNYYNVIFKSIIAEIKEIPAPKGEKPKFREKVLLSDVSYLLEQASPSNGVMRSALYASKILTACGVPNIPVGNEDDSNPGKKQREAIKKARKEYPHSHYIFSLSQGIK